MKRHERRILSMVLVLLLVSGCGHASDPLEPLPDPGSNAEDSSTSICSISRDQVGEKVQASGEIRFMDRSDPMGYFIELIDDGCRIGVWVEKQTFNNWSSELRETFNEGEFVEVDGVLNEIGGELTVDVFGEQTADMGDVQAKDVNVDQGIEPYTGDLEHQDLPEVYQLDVPVVYSGFEGYTGLCYLGSFAMATIYHHPELKFSDVIALSGAGPTAYYFDEMWEVPPFLSNPYWEGTLVNISKMLGSEFGIGLAEYGVDSDSFNPNTISLIENASEVNRFGNGVEALDFLKSVIADDKPVVVFLNTKPVSGDFANVSDFWSERVGDEAGHYMVVAGYDGEYVYLNDPTEPQGTAKDLPAKVDLFLEAWEKTHSPETGELGPFWMVYFTKSGTPPSTDELIRWSASLSESSIEHIVKAASDAGEDDFARFSYRELATSRNQFAAFLAEHGLVELAEIYFKLGDIYGRLGLNADNVHAELMAAAELETQAFELLIEQ